MFASAEQNRFASVSMQGRAPLVLENDHLRRLAPSIFAEQAYDRMSEKYRFVPTIAVLDALRDSGFVPVKAMQSRSRIPGKQDFTKHMVRLRHRDQLGALQALGEEIPEVVLLNSHDGTSAYQLHCGVFRLVCMNGMIVKSSDLGSVSVRHSGKDDIAEKVIEGSFKIIEDAPKAFAAIQDFRANELSPAEQAVFANAAMQLRGEATVAGFNPAAFLQARRFDDRAASNGGRDLWRTMNVVQENMIRGGVRGFSVNEAGQRTRRTTTRAVGSVGEDVRLNRALWTLTEQMQALRTGSIAA